MGDPLSPPDSSRRSASRRSATRERPLACLATIGTVFGCVLAVVLVLSGLGILGVMVLLSTGSIRLFPNK